MDIDTIYRKLGEFVVSFQWLENRFREIGWLILDPDRKHWPPRDLRDERCCDLLDKVEELYLSVIDRVSPEDAHDRQQAFQRIVSDTHEIRRYRNRLVHSAYFELKAGGEVIGLLRSNPKVKEDPVSGEVHWDQEPLTEGSFQSGMERMAKIAFDLNMHYVQLIHWAPFDTVGGSRRTT